MKRKFAVGLLSVAALGGAWSCFTQAQDPIGAARGKRIQTTRTLNADSPAEVVNIVGQDLVIDGRVLSDQNFAVVQTGVDLSFYGNVASIAEQLKSTQGAERDAMVVKLKTAVGEQFDSRQNGKAKELKALEEQLVKLKELHAKRTQQRDLIIADRVQQIVKEADGLGWGTSDGIESTSIFRQPGPARTFSRATSEVPVTGFGRFAPAVSQPSSDTAPLIPPAPAAPPARY